MPAGPANPSAGTNYGETPHSAAALESPGFHHLHLNVVDPQAEIAFYTRSFPTVARDKARVRTIVTATHTRDDLQFALDVFAKVGRQLGILQ